MTPFSTQNPRFVGFVPPRDREQQLISAPALAELPQEAPGHAPERAPKPPSPMSESQTPTPAPAPRARPESSSPAMQVLVVRGAQALAPWVEAWQNLADGACEPNVFYEPWMLLPALAFAPTPEPEFHLIFSPGRGPDSPKPQLCGLFPLVRQRRYKGMRTPVLRLWKHLYCAICTPLLRRGQQAEALSALLDFLAAQRGGATLLELQYVSGDGPFGRAQVEVFSERGTTTFIDEIWTRAMLRPQPGVTGEEYFKGGMSGKRRKEFRRKESRLAEHGAVTYTELEREADPAAALESYITDFLRVESSGWKAETGSAFACDPAHEQFFRTIVTQAHARKRLMLGTLRVGGETVAAKCDFLAGTGAFAFKIGFDEQYARYSPGVLLEMEGIRQLHQNPDVRWIDSCAAPNHLMMNRLWLERRTLQTVVIATGRGRGELVVAGLSLVRYLKRITRRKVRGAQKPILAEGSDQ